MTKQSTAHQEWETYEDDEVVERHCERCGKFAKCEELPFMDYSRWLCRGCGTAAMRSGESV